MLYRSILDFFRQWLRLELPETLPSMQPNCACTFLPLVLTSTFNNEANDTAIVSINVTGQGPVVGLGHLGRYRYPWKLFPILTGAQVTRPGQRARTTMKTLIRSSDTSRNSFLLPSSLD